MTPKHTPHWRAEADALIVYLQMLISDARDAASRNRLLMVKVYANSIVSQASALENLRPTAVATSLEVNAKQ